MWVDGEPKSGPAGLRRDLHVALRWLLKLESNSQAVAFKI